MSDPATEETSPLDDLLAEIASASRFIGAREEELDRLYRAQRARYAKARALGARNGDTATAAGVSETAVIHGIRKHEEQASAAVTG